jgi:hypothetical protein
VAREREVDSFDDKDDYDDYTLSDGHEVANQECDTVLRNRFFSSELVLECLSHRICGEGAVLW